MHAKPAHAPATSTHRTSTAAWGETPEVQALAQELAQRHDLPATWTLKQLARAHPVPRVRQLILPAPTPVAKNWAAYRDRFIEPQRIEAGVRAFFVDNFGFDEFETLTKDTALFPKFSAQAAEDAERVGIHGEQRHHHRQGEDRRLPERQRARHQREGDAEAAERVLTESIAASGQDLRLREQLEEVQVAKPRGRLAVAERLAEQQQTPQALELVQQLRGELARAELAFYTVRTERYSGNMELKYQLGVRLRRLGNFAEAIKVFAQSLEAEPVRALSLLEMGECHQRLKQYAKASEAYQQAIAAAQLPGQLEVKKQGLYRAANLAVGLREFSLAERLYGELLSLDPAFKDARDRLDKIPQIRDSG